MTKSEELMALADLLMEDAPLPPELCDCNTCKSAAALREYAALLNQEPVSWRYQDSSGHWRYTATKPDAYAVQLLLKPVPLYTHPLKAEPAPELTNEEIEAVISGMNRKLTGFQGWGWLDVARALLKAQKEKQA